MMPDQVCAAPVEWASEGPCIVRVFKSGRHPNESVEAQCGEQPEHFRHTGGRYPDVIITHAYRGPILRRCGLPIGHLVHRALGPGYHEWEPGERCPTCGGYTWVELENTAESYRWEFCQTCGGTGVVPVEGVKP